MDGIAEVARPYLQPITHSLPSPISNAIISLLGSTCYKTLILDVNPEATCVKLAVSKGLGIGIIGASSIVKVPQLLKLLSSQSAEGISFLSYVLETAAYLVGLAYNVRQGFPFSTYGETVLIAAQNIVISVLVLHYSGQTAAAGVFVAGLATALYVLFSQDLVGPELMSQLMAGAGVVGVVSKVPQIWAIWQQGGTGQLSAFAVFNYLAGSLSRIFTTLQEVDDPLILYGFIAGFALNAVLAAQMIYYWNSPATAHHAQEAGTRAEKLAVGSSSGVEPRAKSPTTRRRG